MKNNCFLYFNIIIEWFTGKRQILNFMFILDHNFSFAYQVFDKIIYTNLSLEKVIKY